MTFEQFDILLDIGEFKVFEQNGSQFVGITPKKDRYQQKIDQIIDEIIQNEEYPFTFEEFSKKAQQYMPVRRSKTKEILHKLENYNLSEIAHLSCDERLDILNKIMPSEPTALDIERLKPYQAKIGQLMFNLKFPKEFWKQEEVLALKFVHRLQTIPNINENITNWQNLDISDQKKCLEQIVDVFVRTYHIKPIKVSFFSKEEYQNEQKSQGLEPNEVPPTGYALTDKHEICFCKDRMSLCDNYVPIYLTFHEALHISQKERHFSEFEGVEKLFDEKLSYFQLINKESYLLSPIEIHAYAMDKLVQEKAQEVIKAPFIGNKYDPMTKKAVDEATMTSRVLYAYNIRE